MIMSESGRVVRPGDQTEVDRLVDVCNRLTEERNSARAEVGALGQRVEQLLPRMVEVAMFARDGNWSDSTIRDQVRKRLKLGQHADPDTRSFAERLSDNSMLAWKAKQEAAFRDAGHEQRHAQCATAGGVCIEDHEPWQPTLQDQPSAPRVWQKGDPEPDELRVLIDEGETSSMRFLVRCPDGGWVWATTQLPAAYPSPGTEWSRAVASMIGPLTEVLEGGDSEHADDCQGCEQRFPWPLTKRRPAMPRRCEMELR